jgi:hypothetical protein
MNDNLPPNESRPDSTRSTWIRALYMLLFCIAFNIAEFLLMFMALLQLIFKLVTGEANTQLAGFGNTLAEYLAQVTRFLTFDTEKLPFPFNDWPSRNQKLDE